MILKERIALILRWIIITIGSLLFLIISSTIFLLLTHTGNQLVFHFAEKIEPRFSINLESGSLFNEPAYHHISWLDKNIQIEISSVNYAFNWSCLFEKICLDKLQIDGAKVHILTESKNTVEIEKKTNISFELPIQVIFKKVSLSNFSLTIDDLKVDLKSLNLQAEGYKNNIYLQPEITGLRVQLAKSKSEPIKNKKIESALIPLPLAEIVMPLNLHITDLKITNFLVVQNKNKLFELNQLNSKFDFIKSRLTVHHFALSLPETDLTMQGKINFIDKYPLNLQLTGMIKSIKQLSPPDLLTGQAFDLNLSGDLSSLKTELNLSKKINAQLKARVDLFSEKLTHDLELNWQNAGWPFTGKKQYFSKKGRFESRGSINDYKLKLEALYQLENIPSGDLSIIATGNLTSLNIKQLLVNTLDGFANLQGKLDWQKAINWQGELTLNDIDLQQLKTPYRGNFSGNIKHKLLISSDHNKIAWNFSVPEMAINGSFLDYPFSLQGALSGDHQAGFVFKNVKLKNTDNQLLVNGTYAQKSDLEIDVNFNDLSQLIVEAKGSLNGNISLRGTLDKLKINSELQADSLTYQEIKIKHLNLSTSSFLTDKPKVSLTVNTEDITVAGQFFDGIQITIKNVRSTSNSEQHQIDLSLKSEIVSTDLKLQFIQLNDHWVATLSDGKIIFENHILNLNNSFDIILKNKVSENQTIHLTKHCWNVTSPENSDAGKLCLQQADIGENGIIRFDINRYLLTTVNPFLPKELQLSGSLSANTNIKWRKNSKPIFDFNLHSDDMTVIVNLDQKKNVAVIYPVNIFNIKFNSHKNKIALHANIYSKNLIDTKIEGWLLPYKKQPEINTSVNISLPDFSPFTILLPDVDKLTGALTTDLSVKGNMKNPIIDGFIKLEDISLSSVDIPIKIKNLNSLITIKNKNADLKGSFYTKNLPIKRIREEKDNVIFDSAINLFDKTLTTIGSTIKKGKRLTNLDQQIEKEISGKANIEGYLNWSNKLTGNIHFFANKMAIYDYEKLDLLISPDLYLSVTDHIKVSGDVIVDRGKITVKELPEGAISKSKDIIVIDIETKKETTSLPLEISLKIQLGEKLKVDALGLKTTVNGNLLINKKLQKELSIHGELNLVDGSYRALGQQLVLQKSRIIFQGSANSPYISIEAIRDPKKIEDTVTAGVRVTGTPDELKLVLFSDPAMAQQDILSYITRGKSIQSGSDHDSSSQMTSMLIDIGAGQTSGLMNDIGNKVGISDLSLDTSGSGDEQSVGISGYIAPDIEISYGVGVFDSFTIFAIRYEMFERFYIEVSSGLYQAIDAYYEFDWD